MRVGGGGRDCPPRPCSSAEVHPFRVELANRLANSHGDMSAEAEPELDRCRRFIDAAGWTFASSMPDAPLRVG